ncbi:MAG: glycosyltransferase family 39 protein [Candidatus Moranbacteria bacterium]|nr:glycosyltransferase family 39 protein [Candidatus Moranbacteria bacterium]MDD3964564.1 glycosyltransferase family 39 protein [Candidatus Moranbacteria bacterium]
MHTSFFLFFKKQYPRIFFFAIVVCIVLGIFLRSYHFSDWLHFEIDQSYDTLLVSPAVENGIEELPLLGPTAGGGRALRLGPAFYYLEYISAKIFGNTPPGHAALVLIFSFLSLPLFYLFCRRYFTHVLSLGLLLLFSVSLYAVLYSRFSWSPNVLPFLILLLFYSFLRSLSEKESRKNLWFLLSVVVLSITTQIHFNAFFIIPAVVVSLLLLRRPRFKWQTWIIALVIVLVFYSPLIISDIETRGQNIQFFLEKFQHSGGDGKKMLEKAVQTLNYDASEYFLILTGSDHVNGKKLKGYGFSTPGSIAWKVTSLCILFGELLLLLWALKKETDYDKRTFLWLIVLWFILSSLYFFSIRNNGLNIYPRFFLVVLPVPFILFGLILEQLARFKKIGILIGSFLIFLVFVGNMFGLWKYFSNLRIVLIEPISVQTEDIFPKTERVTLEQQYAIVDYMESVQKENGYPIYLQAKHEYEPIFWYHLEKRGIFFQKKIQAIALYREGNYFSIKFSTNDQLNFDQRFELVEERFFGALTVFRFTPRDESVTRVRQNESERETTVQEKQISQIVTWKKFFIYRKEAQLDFSSEQTTEEENVSEIREDARASGLDEEEIKAEINNSIDDLE